MEVATYARGWSDMNARTLQGIHYVTAIAGDPHENVDFYVGVLGLRLVKRTVNQDDPGTYRLFYADAIGSTGADLTFFAWPGAQRGREGAGQASAVALAIPTATMGYWSKRLADHNIAFERPRPRFDEEVIAFSDYHGQAVELVAAPDAGSRQWRAWADSPVPAGFAIPGVHGVTINEATEDPPIPFLTRQLGLRPAGETARRRGAGAGPGGSGARLDLTAPPSAPRGRGAVGTS